jgi:transketolase
MRNRIAKLIELDGAQDDNVLFLTADLGFSVVEGLQASFGERFINLGVAEANMMSVAASLAASGFTPFTYSIAPFVTARCLEQIRNDIAYQKRRVRIVGVGAGFSYGSLGPSHHALEDAHLLCALPGVIVVNPWSVTELERLYALIARADAPAYFRIARETGVERPADFDTLETAAYVLRDGADLNLIASGAMVTQALETADRLAAGNIEARVISAPLLAPFPSRHLASLLNAGPVATVFEGYPGHPLAVAVMELLLAHNGRRRYLDLCAPHAFAARVGNTEALRRYAGLDADSLARRCADLLRAPAALAG